MSSLVPFRWVNGTHLSFGEGAIAAVKEYVQKGAKVMCLFDGDHIYKNGVKNDVDRVMDEIGAAHTWRGGIEPNPDYSTCCKIIDEIRSNPVDILMPIGGGSVMDAAKFISGAVYLPTNTDPWAAFRNSQLASKYVPMISVCTLAATGSEWNERFVISRRATGEKCAGANPKNFFKLSVLDPRYTLTVNEHQTCNGLYDSFCHVMEQYITGHFAPLQDRLSEGVAAAIVENAPKLLANPQDLNARACAMQTSSWALNTLLQTGTAACWGTHRSAMVLTAKYNMDHAETLVTLQTSLWRRFYDVKKFKLAQMAERVWGYHGGSLDEKAQFSITKAEEYAKNLKFGLKISDYAKNERNPQAAVEDMVEHTWKMMGQKGFGENGMVKKEDLKVIYSEAW